MAKTTNTTETPTQGGSHRKGAPNMAEFVEGLQQKIDAGLLSVGNEDGTGFGLDSDGQSENFDKEQFVMFFLAEQPYAFPIGSVIEIIRPMAITPLPNAPAGVEGLINLRGRTLTIISLRNWLGLPPSDAEDLTGRRRIIIYQNDCEAIGFVVDAVAEVVGFTPDNIDRPATLVEPISCAVVRGYAQHNNYVITLIDSVAVAA